MWTKGNGGKTAISDLEKGNIASTRMICSCSNKTPIIPAFPSRKVSHRTSEAKSDFRKKKTLI